MNIGGYLGYFVLYLIITSVLGLIPFVNLISSVLIAPCLIFGFHLVSNQLSTTGTEPSFGEYFNGFQHFSKIIVVAILTGLIILACSLPLIFSVGVGIFTENLNDPSMVADIFSESFTGGVIGIAVLTALVMIYLGVSWSFATLIAVFQDEDAWSAMEISRKIVGKNWFGFLAFFIVLGLINILGAVLLLIGLLFTAPITYCCIYAAYEDVFGEVETFESIEDDDIESIGNDSI
jgi:uncharacterized membrane protein